MNYLYGTLLVGSRKRLRSLKGKHSGRCFIIGNGPSLRNSDLRRLMELGETTFACNSLYYLSTASLPLPACSQGPEEAVVLARLHLLRQRRQGHRIFRFQDGPHGPLSNGRLHDAWS